MTRPAYELSLESKVTDPPRTYHFHTADGVCSKDSFRTAELGLLEHVWNSELGTVLCPEANYGVVGTVLSDTADSLLMTASSARAARLCERNSRENRADASVACLADLSTVDRQFDTVAYAPKSYTALQIGKQRVADALSRLRPSGRCYIAASKRTGLSRYEDCLGELTSTVERVGKFGKYRILRAIRPLTYTAPSYVTPRKICPQIDDVELSLVTVPGLFSPSSLDDGTRLLIEAANVEDGERVLDLCCGYGAVGVHAGRVADCGLWLTDVDTVATNCAERSLRESNVDATVVTADGIEGVANVTFDRILCNPPTHAGDGVLADLFDGAYTVLDSDGQLSIVHHRELDLRDHLSRFDSVEQCRTGDEHVVLNAIP
ncbi:methyltransferase [Haladaptatus sp. CMAA 1911]|uniref:methyltransferase n=1 Tax=unclassified Haladaptatus TaxID=2622732 RepID=UPI003754F36D